MILLLLAGISINMISGQEGILIKAAKAKENSKFMEMIDNINLQVQTKLFENNDVSKINGFESIDYILPEEYRDSLLLIKGKIYISFNADEKIKQLGNNNGIYEYYVNDDRLESLCTSDSEIVFDGEQYYWNDDSGKNNRYTIHNYNSNCVKSNGIQLSKEDKIFLTENAYEHAQTAIITISDFYKDGKSYTLFRNGANNLYTIFKVSNDLLTVSCKSADIDDTYSFFSIEDQINDINTIQIAITTSTEGIQKTYINGKLKGTKDRGKKSWVTVADIGGRYNPYSEQYEYNSNYIVNSVQLYNAELTEKEILNNYKVDKIRYNITE